MKQRIMLSIAVTTLVIFAYDTIVRVLLAWLGVAGLPALPGGTATRTLLLMSFSLLHAWYSLGWKHTLIFLAISAVISLIFEEVGVATGAIFGPYHYTDVLGLKIGLVPILIPIAWFTMIYPSYVIANLITDGEPIGSRGSFWRIAWVALISGMVMTAWDVMVDPILSHPKVQAWVWDRPGSYFDIPIQNYVGWILTTFTVYLVYRLFERRSAPKSIGPLTNRIVGLAVLAYGAMMFSNMLGGPSALIVIGPFSMGLAVVFALDRLFKRKDVT
jgi:putative membrane protein